MTSKAALVTGYAVLRPDGQWALMLINKDYDHPHTVKIVFRDADAEEDAVCRSSRSDYFWQRTVCMAFSEPQDGYADPDGPAARSTLPDGTKSFDLPAASMTVLRGRIGDSKSQ